MNIQFTKNLKTKQTLTLSAVSIVLALVLFLVLGLPKKLTISYIDDIAIVGIVSLGQLIVMINGGIDFSMQGIYCASAIMMSHIYHESSLSNINLPVILIFLMILCVATLIGAINGIMISRFNINPMIMTFTMNALLDGILYAYTSGISGKIAPPAFKIFINKTVIGVPILLIFWILITVILALFFKKTTTGRQMLATGTNKAACQLSGFNVNRITTISYALSALFASIAGMMACANNGTSMLSMADNVTIQSLVIAVAAGASVFGGKGSVYLTLVGAFAYTSLNYIFRLFPIHSGVQDIIIGLLLMLMILPQVFIKHHFKRKDNKRIKYDI